MARLAANGVLVSDNGQWVYTGFRWKPLVDDAADKPKMSDASGPAFKAANSAKGPAMGVKAKQLLTLVPEHGSLEAYEHQVGVQEAKGQSQLTKTYANQDAFVADMPLMQAKGWRVLTQTQAPTHTTAARVGTGMAVGAILTGGVGAAVGGALGAASKKKGGLAVVYERQAPAGG